MRQLEMQFFEMTKALAEPRDVVHPRLRRDVRCAKPVSGTRWARGVAPAGPVLKPGS
jgi:hypothetical protein